MATTSTTSTTVIAYRLKAVDALGIEEWNRIRVPSEAAWAQLNKLRRLVTVSVAEFEVA